MQCPDSAIDELTTQARGLMRVLLRAPVLGMPDAVSKQAAERVASAVRDILRSTTWTEGQR